MEEKQIKTLKELMGILRTTQSNKEQAKDDIIFYLAGVLDGLPTH